MDNSKARMAAAAVNRKLPADATLRREYYVEGRSVADIARRYGVDTSAVYQMFHKRGWPLERPAEIAIPVAPALREDEVKIIVRRQVLHGDRDCNLVRIAISLPRIPTIHGHFVAAIPSTIGA